MFLIINRPPPRHTSYHPQYSNHHPHSHHHNAQQNSNQGQSSSALNPAMVPVQPGSNFFRKFSFQFNTFSFRLSCRSGEIGFDGKMLRKAMARKTVDYNPSIIRYLEVKKSNCVHRKELLLLLEFDLATKYYRWTITSAWCVVHSTCNDSLLQHLFNCFLFYRFSACTSSCYSGQSC